MSDSQKRIVEFENLNALGKAIFVGGSAARLTAGLIDRALDRATDLVVDAERAFRQGLDGSIEDAKIIEELEEPRRSRAEGPAER